MEARRLQKRLSIALAVIGVALVTLGIAVSVRSRESANSNNKYNGAQTASQSVRVQAGSLLKQTLVYQRCGHSVLRTLDTPADWVGLTLDELQPKLDMAWRVTDFSASSISMRENLMLFCPQHWVLMPDESGVVCVWVNRYGEGMERVYESEWTLSQLPEPSRESIRIGKPFDLLEDAEDYLVKLTTN